MTRDKIMTLNYRRYSCASNESEKSSVSSLCEAYPGDGAGGQHHYPGSGRLPRDREAQQSLTCDSIMGQAIIQVTEIIIFLTINNEFFVRKIMF